MTKANLVIMGNRAILETDSESKTSMIDSNLLKPEFFRVDETFQKRLIQHLVENNIRVTKTEKLY